MRDNRPYTPRLTRAQWDALAEQLSRTPDPNEGSSGTGEHWQLIALLNRFGFNPFSRQEAVRLAQELIDNGYDYQPQQGE
jgi:hypothetical protein